MDTLYLSAQAFTGWHAPPHQRVLGMIRFSGGHTPSPINGEAPFIDIPARPVNDGSDLYEMWRTFAPSRSQREGAIHFSIAENLLWGCLSIPGRRDSLRKAAQAAYDEILCLLLRQGMPHLYRVWNYIPDINRQEDGSERYHLFNEGRLAAFSAAGLPVRHSAAATAVGIDGDTLCVVFLAGKQPQSSIENPRQISAYHYPPQYGASPPVFSRAGLLRMQEQSALFISGTAGIVGHRSLHAGDVRAQTRETLTNIAALLEETNKRIEGKRIALSDLEYKVYLRDAGDAAAVTEELQRRVGKPARLHLLQAAICRLELLVEIEAVALWDDVNETAV